jgi:hypothetical protein
MIIFIVPLVYVPNANVTCMTMVKHPIQPPEKGKDSE